MYSPRSPYARTRVASAPGLLGQVLGISGVGFLITALAAYLFQGVGSMVGLIAMLVGFGLLFAVNRVANPAVALLWFYAFAFAEGIGIAPILARYIGIDGGRVVFDAASTTGLGMLVLGGVAFTFSVDWRRFQGLALGALVALIVVGLISAFTHFIHPNVYSWLTLGVFTLLTLVDFARIRAGGDGLNPVQLAAAIYLDALNIFLAFLQLFGNRSRDD